MDRLQIALCIAVAVHAIFMVLELLPPSFPILLRLISASKLKPNETLSNPQQVLVANIVKNAGIYNGIVAAALLATAFTGDRDVARVLFTGVTVAGFFGAATLSPWALLQALAGAIGLAAFYYP